MRRWWRLFQGAVAMVLPVGCPTDNGDFQMSIVDGVTHPLVRVDEPDWTQVTPDDVEDHIDDLLTGTLVDWLLR